MTLIEEKMHYVSALQDYNAAIERDYTKHYFTPLQTGFGFCWYFAARQGVNFSDLVTLYEMFLFEDNAENSTGFWFKEGELVERRQRLTMAISLIDARIKREYAKTLPVVIPVSS